MKKIVLFCAGGMSTSILVKNMKEAAAKENPPFECSVDAFAASQAQKEGKDADAILIGPQIRFQKDSISKQCPGVPIEAIDMKVYGKADGKGALAIAKKLMGL